MSTAPVATRSCFLRSPPFPGVDADVAAISRVVPAAATAVLDEEQRQTARALLAELRQARVGGSFWAARHDPTVRDHVVIAPRNAGELDALIARGGENPCVVTLAGTGWPRGVADALRRRGMLVHVGHVDPWSLLAGAVRVHAHGDDELVLVARITGIPVDCASSGTYAPAGEVATDEAALEALVHRVLVDTARYRDCFSDQPVSAARAIDCLADWRRGIDASRGIAAATGISWWKRNEIRAFCWSGDASSVRFHRTASGAVATAARAGGDIAVWPSRAPAGLERKAAAREVSLRRVEDGFIRSVGLGSDLQPPMSVVIDRRGIYYDPSVPSDLEHILATTDFTPVQIERANRLIATVIAAGISKYGSSRARFSDLPPAGRRVLVPGQVEDDQSVKLGGGDVAGNLDLLRRVRAIEPDAFILYKPHPDVVAGHRRGYVAVDEALQFADRVVDAPMPALLDAIDAVHVWTSLTGFEALLRGREVTTHGTPFFAGWGLTTDCGPASPRRTRRLTLAGLVCGTLILYPRYLDPVTRLPCQPETLVARLAEPAVAAPTMLTRLRQAQGRLRAGLAGARS